MAEAISESQYQDISPATSDPDGVNSLPDSASSDDIDDDEDDEQESDAERQWQESLQQMELLLTMVVVPYAGKYFGRKFAYWSEYARHPKSHTITRTTMDGENDITGKNAADMNA